MSCNNYDYGCYDYSFLKDLLTYAMENELRDRRDSLDVYRDIRKELMPNTDNRIKFDSVDAIVEGISLIGSK